MNSYEDLFKSICRLCLSHSKYDTMVHLFDNNNELSVYGQCVISFANISLKPDNNPTMMCRNCLLLLKHGIKFKLQCENSVLKLQKLMKLNQTLNRDYKEVLYDYTLFNLYFPKERLDKSSSIDGNNEKPFKIDVLNQNHSGDLINTSHRNNFIKVENTDKISKNICDDYNQSNSDHPDDIHNEKDSNIQEKDLKNMILNSLEKIFVDNTITSTMPILYRSKRKHKLKRIVQRMSKKFECNLCNKVLSNKLTYDRHMQRHNGCRYMCESCAKSFPTQEELNTHQVSCHGIGRYLQCNHCPFKAPRRLVLIEHLRLHTGERPFTCEKCGLTFRRKAIWRTHLIYHSEKTFQCPHCPKKFFRHCGMLAHMNNIHDRLYVFMCNKCGATYAKPITVRRHLSDKHGIPRELQGKILRVMKTVDSDVTF